MTASLFAILSFLIEHEMHRLRCEHQMQGDSGKRKI